MDAAAPPPPKARRSVRRLLLAIGLALLLFIVLLAGALFGGGRWLLATDAGTAWLLARLPMVQVKGFEGAALGGRWRAQSLRVEWDGGRQWLLIEDLEADGLQWKWRPNAHAWVALRADRVTARTLTVHTGPASGQPTALPKSIALPAQIDLGQVRVAQLRIGALQPIADMQADELQLEARPGERHAFKRIVAQGYGIALDGAARVQNTAPFALEADAAVRPTLDGDTPRWTAALRARGNIDTLALTGTLRGVARPAPPGAKAGAAAAPAIDLHAELRPLRAWPLAALDLRTQALDLSALLAQAPATRLSGDARLSGGEGGEPLRATLNLVNALPGRWNEARLPIAGLMLELSGQLDRRDRIEAPRFEVRFADAARRAGTLSGSATWAGPELSVQARIDDLTPQRLHGRAAAMTVSGPLVLNLRGLPLPTQTAAAPAPAPHLTWNVDLQGRLDAAPQPVRVKLAGSADADHVELTDASASAGAASAQLKARLARATPGRGGPWLLTTAGTVVDFDPLPWWPGDAADTAWRKGPHRLSGGWQFDLRLPANAAQLKPLALLQRLAGNGSLRIRESMFAGVALSADARLGYTPSNTTAPGTLSAELVLGGNRLALDARGDPADTSPNAGAGDRWRAELQADSLPTIAPLVRLVPALAEWAPRQGRAAATIDVAGRWPTLRTEGSASVSQLQAGKLALVRGAADWRIDTAGPAAPLAAQLALSGIAWDKQRADHLHATLRGTLAEHRIELAGALPLLPPPVAEQVLAIRAQQGTQAWLQARGGWTSHTTGGGTWRTTVDRLAIGAWDGGAASAAPAASWGELRDLRATLAFDADANLQTLDADAGRLRIGGGADALALRWDAVHLDLRPEQPLIRLRADVEPFLLAPLLARAQPGMGWSGDLRLAARVEVRAAERMDADIVFERRDGDLHMTATGEATQLLGLTDVRLSLTAHDGLWVFTPLLRGRSLGDIGGRVEARTGAERRWPHADAPLTGSVQARVADIGIWGAWVPAGWRLGGELRTTATLGGRFGAPQYTGEVTGNNIAVRNLLQGVNVSEGNVAIALQGDTARIERFTLRGGDGMLNISGATTLALVPQGRLQFEAERFRVLGRVDRTLVVSGRAEAQFGAGSTRIDGKLRIDQGLFDLSRGDAPSLDDDVNVRRNGAQAAAGADPAAPAPRRNLTLAIDVDLGTELRARGYGLDIGLTGQLRITSPGGRLAVNGTIASDGGTYKAYGQNLVIERGLIAFGGVLENPRLDVLALRPNIDQRVGVQIGGTAQNPRVRLFSEPEMSDTDKLSWLVLGRAPDGLGRNDTALLQRAAVALLSGDKEAPTDQLMKALGIDEVSLRQSGEGDVRETVITIGKQLSRRWYLGYERGVNSTTGTWQLIYRIAQRFTLRLQSGLENAADVIWTWRLQETPADAGVRKSIVTPP